MSNQSSSNKNWLYFAFSSGTTLLLGTIVLILLNIGKSAQSQTAGTWKVEANGTPAGTPEIKIIISPDRKITALNPTNDQEAIEVGKITKVSDVATLPDNAKVQANSFAFANQPMKVALTRSSEGKTLVESMNMAQQAYYLEKERWAKTIDEMELGIKSESVYYRYNIQNIGFIKTANIKNYPGITVHTGLAKNEGFKSYLGVVYLSPISDSDITSLRILCESIQPTTKKAGLPKFDGKAVQCPDGYKSLSDQRLSNQQFSLWKFCLNLAAAVAIIVNSVY